MADLDAIIEEGEKLEKAFGAELAAGIVGVAPRGAVKAARERLNSFYFRNGARLLRIAREAASRAALDEEKKGGDRG